MDNEDKANAIVTHIYNSRSQTEINELQREGKQSQNSKSTPNSK